MNFEEYVFPIILAVIFLILLIVYYWYVRKIVLYILKKLGIESSSGYRDERGYESTFRAIANISITDERWGRKILGYLIVVMFVFSVILLSIAFIILGAFLLGYF